MPLLYKMCRYIEVGLVHVRILHLIVLCLFTVTGVDCAAAAVCIVFDVSASVTNMLLVYMKKNARDVVTMLNEASAPVESNTYFYVSSAATAIKFDSIDEVNGRGGVDYHANAIAACQDLLDKVNQQTKILILYADKMVTYAERVVEQMKKLNVIKMVICKYLYFAELCW